MFFIFKLSSDVNWATSIFKYYTGVRKQHVSKDLDKCFTFSIAKVCLAT